MYKRIFIVSLLISALLFPHPRLNAGQEQVNLEGLVRLSDLILEVEKNDPDVTENKLYLVSCLSIFYPPYTQKKYHFRVLEYIKCSPEHKLVLHTNLHLIDVIEAQSRKKYQKHSDTVKKKKFTEPVLLNYESNMDYRVIKQAERFIIFVKYNKTEGYEFTADNAIESAEKSGTIGELLGSTVAEE